MMISDDPSRDFDEWEMAIYKDSLEEYSEFRETFEEIFRNAEAEERYERNE